MSSAVGFFPVEHKVKPAPTDLGSVESNALTKGLLTLSVKKDFSVAETKLKKLFDKGVPNLLCQEKDTTISYPSLVKYRDILVSLENMFELMQENEEYRPKKIGPLPQIDMVFNSGILNSIAEEQYILWVKQNGKIQIEIKKVFDCTFWILSTHQLSN